LAGEFSIFIAASRTEELESSRRVYHHHIHHHVCTHLLPLVPGVRGPDLGDCPYVFKNWGEIRMGEQQLIHVIYLGNQNSYLVKRNTNGGVRFSRDPLNLTNVHSRKVCLFGLSRRRRADAEANTLQHAGFVNDKVR
jgi:hypothetical protein